MTDLFIDDLDPDIMLTDIASGLDFDTATDVLEVSTVEGSSVVDAKVLDGAAIVQMLAPQLCKTFLKYSSTIFEPYILQLETASRIDVVWDV